MVARSVNTLLIACSLDIKNLSGSDALRCMCFSDVADVYMHDAAYTREKASRLSQRLAEALKLNQDHQKSKGQLEAMLSEMVQANDQLTDRVNGLEKELTYHRPATAPNKSRQLSFSDFTHNSYR